MPFPNPAAPGDYLEYSSPAAPITAPRPGEYNSAVRVLDADVATVVDGYVILDIAAIDTANADEVYTITVEVSDDASFNTGVVEHRSVSVLAIGQQALPFSNQVNGTTYRYFRLVVTPSGTTPSITLNAWWLDAAGLDNYTLATLTRVMAVAVNRFTDASTEFRSWASGLADGGPNSDGRYPLSDGAGNSYLVKCPAAIAADAASNITASSITSQTLETTPLATPASTMPHLVGVVDPGGAGEALRKFPVDLFASRRTRDLQDFPTIIGTELIPAMQVGGLEGRIAISELLRRTAGIIDPTFPPYNCKFDAKFLKARLTDTYRTQDIGALDGGDDIGGETTAGSARVHIGEALFTAEDVGKTIQLSNAGAGGQPLKTTIATYVGPQDVDMAVNASNTAVNDVLWGTDNTVGMQAALDAAHAAGGESLFNYGGVVLCPAGGCLTGALRYKARIGIFGRGVRQTTFYRLNDGATAWAWFEFLQTITASQVGTGHPAIGRLYDDYPQGIPSVGWTPSQPCGTFRNWRMFDTDFLAMGDLAINGARYTNQTSYRGLEYIAAPGYINHPQIDPYPMISRMHISDAGDDGLLSYGRHSGSMFGVEIIGCGNFGGYFRCYDANITNVLAIANDGPGLYLPEEAANNNFLNAKISFNGFNGHGSYLYNQFGAAMQTNVYITGDTNQITNLRCQESYGCNLWVGGNGNQFGDVGLDDTGNIGYKAGFNANNVPPVRAAIIVENWTLNGNGGKDNRFNDVGYGPAVSVGQDYATHGIFFFGRLASNDEQRMPTGTTGRVYTKSVGAYCGTDISGKTVLGKTPGVNFPSGSNFSASATMDTPTPGAVEGMCERSWFYNGTSATDGGETKAVITAAVPTSNVVQHDEVAAHTL